MPLNLGEIYVSLTARTEGLTRGLKGGLSAIEATSKKIAEVSEKVAGLSAVFVGFGGVMAAEASKYDRSVAAAVNGLKDSYSQMAVEVARTLVPAMRSLGEVMQGIIKWFRDLSPETKDIIAKFAEFVAFAAPIAMLTSKISGLVGALSSIGGALLPVLPMVAAVAAGVFGIVAGIGAVSKAVKALRGATKGGAGAGGGGGDFMSGLKDQANLIGNYWAKALAPVADFGVQIGKDIKDSVQEGLDVVGLTQAVDGLKKMLAPTGGTFGTASMATLKDLQEAENKITEGAKEWLAERQKLESEGFDAEVTAVREAIDSALERRAEIARLEEKGFDSLVAATNEAIDEGLKKRQEAAAARGSKFGKLGDAAMGGTQLGGLIEAGAKGAASGGAMGAIGGVAAQLVLNSKSFADTMLVLNGLLQSLADVVGMVVQPVQPLIAAFMGIVEAIGGALQPAFDVLAEVIKPFVPIIVLVGELLKAFAPALGVMAAIFVALQMPMQLLIGKALPIFFSIIKFLGLSLMKFVKAVAPTWNSIIQTITDVWNGMINGLRSALSGLTDFEVFGFHPFEGITRFLDGLTIPTGALQIDLQALSESIVALEGLTWDAAMAKAQETAQVLIGKTAVKELGETARKVGEELTNIPEGFKVAGFRLAAMDPAQMVTAMGEHAATAVGTATSQLTAALTSSGATNSLVSNMMLPEETTLMPLDSVQPPPAALAPVVNVEVMLDKKIIAAEVSEEANMLRVKRIWETTGLRETF